MKKVLLVEDDLAIQCVLNYFLKNLGLEVVMFENGYDAWNYWNSQKDIDLIVTDIMMPKIGGIELAKLIVSNENGKNVPIIAVSATNKENYSEEEMENFLVFLEKPFTKSQFMDTINDILILI
ncbi:response regulator [Belliella kenyensis]|uniref:Response regulator n=1 Tax=Belliella kenyensis TaxID=1472724 RepID=A0ABV8EML6_9BACT|nr:response regulator [Belliella kenyensis]MCH7400532.1 response regulator [Belliella kenyensis]MDN3604452.1 response regulator [Belliella kenyensis]